MRSAKTPVASWLLISATAVGLSGCSPQAEHGSKPPTLVDAVAVSLADYSPRLSLTGEIQARNQTQLSFRLSGQIKDRLVDVGDHVTAGQTLARIDDVAQQADVQAAKAALDAADAQVQLAQATFDRQSSLLAQGVTTRSSFETAQTALQTAQGSRDAAQAQLGTAEEALTYTNLVAPSDGVITERNLEVGEVAQAASPIFVLAEDGPRDAVFNVQEAVFLGNTHDVEITIALTTNPSVNSKGTLREISPALDPQTGTVLVKVAIDTPTPDMTLGGTVTGTVQSSPIPKAVLPWSALWSTDGHPAVWIIDPTTNAVSLQPIEVDTYQTGSIVVEQGVKEGQLVVTHGSKLLVPGQIVATKLETAQ